MTQAKSIADGSTSLSNVVTALGVTVTDLVASLPSGTRHYTSRVDNYTNYPIRRGTLPYWWRTAHHVDVPSITAGSTWLVLGQGQARSDWDFNIEAIARVGWSGPTLLDLDRPGGQETNGMSDFYIVGSNFRQTREHYFAWQRVGIHTFTSALANVRFHNDVRFNSTDAAIDGSGNQAVFAGVDQGGITAFRLR